MLDALLLYLPQGNVDSQLLSFCLCRSAVVHNQHEQGHNPRLRHHHGNQEEVKSKPHILEGFPWWNRGTYLPHKSHSCYEGISPFRGFQALFGILLATFDSCISHSLCFANLANCKWNEYCCLKKIFIGPFNNCDGRFTRKKNTASPGKNNRINEAAIARLGWMQ